MLRKPARGATPCAALLLLTLSVLYAQQGVPENAVMRVSDHVHAIIGFPNIAFVVGSRGTLVVDTGMGVPNGAIVVREAGEAGQGPEPVSHHHAFPPRARRRRTGVSRPDRDHPPRSRSSRNWKSTGRNSSKCSAASRRSSREELQDVKLRAPDLVFDREVTLDLGGVTARLFWLGAAHTLGDELIFVNPDSALISGDIVQNKIVPNMPNADATVKGWLSILDQARTVEAALRSARSRCARRWVANRKRESVPPRPARTRAGAQDGRAPRWTTPRRC